MRCYIPWMRSATLACLAAASFAAAGAPASADAAPGSPAVGELSAAIAAPRLAGARLSTDAAVWTLGHLRLELAGAEVYPLVAAGLPVGVFVGGPARLTYVSEYPYEREVFPLNVGRVTPWKVAEGTLAVEVGSALVLDPAIAARLPGFAVAGEAPEAAAKALVGHLARFADDLTAPANLVAQAILEGTGEGVAVAQVRADRRDLVYVHDALRHGEERLEVMQRFPTGMALSGKRYAEGLSRQPLGAPLERWPARFVLSHVDLELVNPGERRMQMVVREKFDVGRPLRTLELELWENRFTGDGLLPYRLEAVTTPAGDPVPHSRLRDDLVVALPAPARAGDTVELVFRLSGDVLDRPGGHGFWWLPIGHWLPIPPRLDNAHFTYHSVVKAAKPYRPFSMGAEVRRWQEGDLECVENRLDQPVQFAVVLAGKYHTYAETREGLTITLASYAFSHDESMRRIANNVFEMKTLYEKLLGAFPFAELQILEINEYGFGIAPPGVIYLTREAFDPGPEGRAFREELNHRMAHEVAHMYWGHVAQMSTYDDQWLSESTAEYYGAVATGHFLGKKELREAERAWKQQATLAREVDSIYLANRIAGEKGFRERYALLYARGPLMLQELREELGDEAFFTIMKSYLTNFRFQPILTKKFLEITNFITKRDYTAWFEQRLFGLEPTARAAP